MPIYTHSNDILSEKHQNMLKWSSAVGLSLNLKKTFLWIHRARQVAVPFLLNLSSVDEVRTLGVILFNDLKWNKHCDSIFKCSRRFYALRVLKPLLQMQT